MGRRIETADRYARALWALREQRKVTKRYQATAAEIASVLPPFREAPNAQISLARTLRGLCDARLVWSSHDDCHAIRDSCEAGGRKVPKWVISTLNQPARYGPTTLGETVTDMLALVGDPSRGHSGTMAEPE